jgi:hypothetical protein
MTLLQLLILAQLTNADPNTLPPWWAIAPSQGGGAQIIELDETVREPNPCGPKNFRVIAGRAPREPVCIQAK